ncbi:hypothetical protein FB451DRAFT_1172343 [Mycena latifolia]|nr:hypothetical protein FB451DRAFT_1172343 [Mycena latifolia]
MWVCSWWKAGILAEMCSWHLPGVDLGPGFETAGLYLRISAGIHMLALWRCRCSLVVRSVALASGRRTSWPILESEIHQSLPVSGASFRPVLSNRSSSVRIEPSVLRVPSFNHLTGPAAGFSILKSDVGEPRFGIELRLEFAPHLAPRLRTIAAVTELNLHSARLDYCLGDAMPDPVSSRDAGAMLAFLQPTATPSSEGTSSAVCMVFVERGAVERVRQDREQMSV